MCYYFFLARLYKHPPAFLSIQQLPVSHDLSVQDQLDVHELLVLTGHVLLCLLQLREFALCILDNHFPVLLSCSNVSFWFASLQVGDFHYCHLFARVLNSSELLNLPVCVFIHLHFIIFSDSIDKSLTLGCFSLPS